MEGTQMSGQVREKMDRTFEMERWEQADKLAQELSEIGLKHGDKLPEVNVKMGKLMELLADLAGQEVEQKVGENGILRFRAADRSKWYSAGGMNSLSYAEKIEGEEKPVVVAFIDKHGGSSLMQEAGQVRGFIVGEAVGGFGKAESWAEEDKYTGWLIDEQYRKDMAAIEKDKWHSVYDPYYAPIGANRFREMRMAARMARMLLAGAKETT